MVWKAIYWLFQSNSHLSDLLTAHTNTITNLITLCMKKLHHQTGSSHCMVKKNIAVTETKLKSTFNQRILIPLEEPANFTKPAANGVKALLTYRFQQEQPRVTQINSPWEDNWIMLKFSSGLPLILPQSHPDRIRRLLRYLAFLLAGPGRSARTRLYCICTTEQVSCTGETINPLLTGVKDHVKHCM